MRICIVTFVVPQHGIGGMQDHTRDLAHGLVRAGHQVDVITSRHPEGKPEETVNGVRYRFVDSPRHQNHPLWLRESYAEFARLEAEQPFDVVHSESTSAIGLLRRGVNRRVPLIIEFHGNFLGLARAELRRGVRSRRPVPLLRALRAVQWLATHDHFRHGAWYRFRACEAILPSRRALTDTCRSHLLDSRRVHVVPNGIDSDVFRPRPRAEARARLGLTGGPLFICVGRLSRDKGMHHAVRALALLAGEGSSARLVIVGGGEEHRPLEALARRLGVEDRVLFAGAQTHELVASYLAAADVFLFPTEREEAAPLVLPQAMACARPVIATRIGGITEVVGESGEHGVLIPPRDVTALASAMRTLIGDEALRRRLGEAARNRVLAEYTIERMTERTLAVYDLATERLRRPSGC